MHRVALEPDSYIWALIDVVVVVVVVVVAVAFVVVVVAVAFVVVVVEFVVEFVVAVVAVAVAFVVEFVVAFVVEFAFSSFSLAFLFVSDKEILNSIKTMFAPANSGAIISFCFRWFQNSPSMTIL
jgi:hypothetical protein